MMNGNPVNDMPLPAFGNQQIVSAVAELLEKVLVEAKAGRVMSVGIVMVDPNGGVATPWVGPQIPQLHLAAGMMQARIIRSIEAPPPKSSIIPARHVG